MLPPPPSFTPDTPTPTATGAYSIAAIANQRNYSVAAPSRVSGWEVVQAADPSTIPCRRSLHAAAVWKDNFIVFGGYDGARRVNDLHSFHFPTNDWRQLNQVNAPSPRDRHIAVVYDDSLYIFGGFDGESRVNGNVLFVTQLTVLFCAVDCFVLSLFCNFLYVYLFILVLNLFFSIEHGRCCSYWSITHASLSTCPIRKSFSPFSPNSTQL